MKKLNWLKWMCIIFIFKCESESDLHIYKTEHVFVYYLVSSHLLIEMETSTRDDDYIDVLQNTTVNI